MARPRRLRTPPVGGTRRPRRVAIPAGRHLRPARAGGQTGVQGCGGGGATRRHAPSGPPRGPPPFTVPPCPLGVPMRRAAAFPPP
ncbi:hypothetical protein BU14_0109s0027 [Porphyra umbilicalis]|uniref:Uncharacterized protein n=1 Tax=Porphyra umbilicalis TaxID=2786 RepID=A0A1X6PC52_PORUM|nr:hypothetical protein BU14_0109s0027 [Porphyra umbilicalis]|eukprot:OSX78427.1 hypothetical protein BU14_0109s0027 [Porphyra umbilicalis]